MPSPTLFEIQVVPNATRDEIAGLHGEAVKIRLRAPAVEGKANEALILFLSEVLGVPKKTLSLEMGDRSRKKRVRVVGMGLEEIYARLGIRK